MPFSRPPKTVASMFALNLDTLRRGESIKANYSERELDTIASALSTWARDLRQVAVEARISHGCSVSAAVCVTPRS